MDVKACQLLEVDDEDDDEADDNDGDHRKHDQRPVDEDYHYGSSMAHF